MPMLSGGSKTTILITGAAGFMGSHLFDYLSQQGHTVYGLDNYSIGTYVHQNIAKIDLLEKSRVDDYIQTIRPQVIYHLAAWAHEGLSQFSPIKITENNYQAYLNVIVPAIKYATRRIVVTSSMSVYGNQTPPFYETMERQPVDIYGLAKTAMEHATEILSKVHGTQYNIVRPHNVYGERQNMADPYRNVVGIFINCILRNKPLYIYGDGMQTRAFSYVGDVTPYLAETGFTHYKGQIFNVGTTEEHSINELLFEIRKHFPDYTLKPKYVTDRPLEVKHAFCTNEKMKQFFGYKTKTSFAQGIKRMCEWAKTEGAKNPIYLKDGLEIEKGAPDTWVKHLI